eukprot:UN03702
MCIYTNKNDNKFFFFKKEKKREKTFITILHFLNFVVVFFSLLPLQNFLFLLHPPLFLFHKKNIHTNPPTSHSICTYIYHHQYIIPLPSCTVIQLFFFFFFPKPPTTIFLSIFPMPTICCLDM